MSSIPAFSERESDVISHLMQGRSNKQIALALGITPRTVGFHLANIYAKLNAASRAEAIIRLTEIKPVENPSPALAADPGKSTVEKWEHPPQNGSNAVPQRRPLMGRPFRMLIYIILIVILCAVGFLVIYNFSVTRPPAVSSQNLATPPVEQPSAAQSLQSSPTPTAREALTAQVIELAAEYDLSVKEELEKGDYQTATDPLDGEKLILFADESKVRLLLLYDDLNTDMQDLLQQYEALYIAEVRPTPFPTAGDEENKALFHQLETDYPAFFEQVLAQGPTVQVFDPGEGKYLTRVIGDAYARSEIMADAMGALLTASAAAGLDQDAHMALIRAALGSPDLPLTFAKISNLANAPFVSAAVYTDEQGVEYSVAIDTGRLAGIDTLHSPDVAAIDVKSMEDVRQLADVFARANSPHLSASAGGLDFEQGSKGDMYFYTWRLTGENWADTPWRIMPPFLQIGMSADGVLVNYINTLDLYTPAVVE